MKEYTLYALASACIAVGVDHALGTRVIRKKAFWVFIAVMFAFKLVVNGYLTWRPIVLYNPDYFMNIRLFTIPLEDFAYGFGLITLSVTLWEYFKHGARRHSHSSDDL